MDLASFHINWFDLGSLHGDEIQWFLDAVNCPHTVYAVEAYKPFSDALTERYRGNQNVHVYNYAIGTRDKLYIADNDGEGNSIYDTKRNVDKNNYVDVEPIELSAFIRKHVPDFDTSINILRYNIEGAEYDMMYDITTNGYLFDAYLSGELDLPKVGELKDKVDEYNQLLKAYKIHPQMCSRVFGCVDLHKMICGLQSTAQ